MINKFIRSTNLRCWQKGIICGTLPLKSYHYAGKLSIKTNANDYFSAKESK
jgi:hypothetical protein